MYTGIYRIAGLVWEFRTLHQEVHALCADYRSGAAPDLTLAIEQADLDRERAISAREDALEGKPVRHFPDSYLETLAVYRKLVNQAVRRDLLLFHGSAIAVEGRAYLFTAKSGTGKSTHTRLWRELLGEKALMVNDDKPLLKVEPTGVEVYGTPWNGKHHLGTNTSAPLRAICILERGEVNEIHPISVREALPALMQQSYRPASPADLPPYLDLLDRLAQNVKFYRLRCNMEPEAAQVSYEALRQA